MKRFFNMLAILTLCARGRIDRPAGGASAARRARGRIAGYRLPPAAHRRGLRPHRPTSPGRRSRPGRQTAGVLAGNR